jgi:hypothetical protein
MASHVVPCSGGAVTVPSYQVLRVTILRLNQLGLCSFFPFNCFVTVLLLFLPSSTCHNPPAPLLLPLCSTVTLSRAVLIVDKRLPLPLSPSPSPFLSLSPSLRLSVSPSLPLFLSSVLTQAHTFSLGAKKAPRPACGIYYLNILLLEDSGSSRRIGLARIGTPVLRVSFLMNSLSPPSPPPPSLPTSLARSLALSLSPGARRHKAPP